MKRYQSDVLIIGGGLAGICAAIELLDRGCSVLILDRDEEGSFGGLAKRSFGGIFLVDTREQRRSGIRDSVDLAFDDWVRTGELHRRDALARVWAKSYLENVRLDVEDWLRKRGITFFPVVHWVERGMYEPGNSVPRFHMVWGTGHRLVEVLRNVLFDHPRSPALDVRFGHRVVGLEVANGRVTGAHGISESEGEQFRVEAESVIIAAGGFCGSDDWLRAHWEKELGTPPDLILNGSHRYATGEIHMAAESAGADVINRDRVWYYAAGVHHPRPRHPNHGLSIIPPKSAVWLDRYGRRIGPEPLVSGFDTRHLVSGVCRSGGGYSWQVMNWRIACKELAVSGSEFNDAMRERKRLQFLKQVLLGNKSLVERLVQECEDFVVARSVGELAARMNDLTGNDDVDAHVLQATLERYDGSVARAGSYMNDDQLRRIAHLRMYRGDRVRTSKSQRIVDPKALPLLAIREFLLSRKSLGGIRTDLGSRVLRSGNRDRGHAEVSHRSPKVTEHHSPIPGLFAVGESAGFGGGGIHGKRSLEGTFLGTCIFTGRVAARTIAEGG